MVIMVEKWQYGFGVNTANDKFNVFNLYQGMY